MGTGDENGFITNRFIANFRQFARGGIAIVSVGNCTIDINESSDEGNQIQLSNPRAINMMAKILPDVRELRRPR